ncbi:hypothetical protein C8N46_101446 [Kordia periserrulae]|uniref:Uncharacterized protein n=1 Tax=Kordia periserrulae TaxID=701523 RepID=A0A2T6C696_9FLAO|nr:hypothetical protein [Kordia periserrulae]PTX63838.1 hypothetical protein C8N46_101446 [Kordia periserrulae]
MIKPLFILLLALPFIYLGYKSLDLATYKRHRKSIYIVKEYPVFIIGCALFAIAGVIIINYRVLMDFL